MDGLGFVYLVFKMGVGIGAYWTLRGRFVFCYFVMVLVLVLFIF